MGAHRDSLAVEAFDDEFDDQRPLGDLLPSASASLDNTMPPTPLRDLLAADGASIFVLSPDADLRHAIERAGGEQFPLFFVHSWAELVHSVASRRTHIVVVDADALDQSIDSALRELAHVADMLVVIVAAERDHAQPLMRLMSERKIHRLLIKPPAQGITRLLLESAVSRYLQWREVVQPPALLVEDFPRRRRAHSGGRPVTPWLLATALVSMIVVGAVVAERSGFEWRAALEEVVVRATDAVVSPDEAGVAGVESTATSMNVRPESVARPDLVEQDGAGEDVNTLFARSIDAEERATDPELAHPPERNAIEAEPPLSVGRGLIEADQPLDSSPAAAEADLALAPERTAAEADLALAPERETTDERGAAEAEPTLAPARTAVDAALPLDPEFAAVEAELVTLLELVDLRLADERLVGPGDDNALSFFLRAVALRPNDPRVLSRRTWLAAALVDEARLVLHRGALGDAQYLAEQAFRLGAERESLARLELELEDARRERILERHASLLARGRALLRDGTLVGNGGDNALAHLAALRREGSSVPGLAQAWQELADTLSSNVRAAIAAGQFDHARTLASALAIRGGDAELASALEFDAIQAAFLATPAASGTLELIDSAPLDYPIDAQRSGAEGWVHLEYIVDESGRTRNITVLDSRPRRIFDEAAVDVVSRHRYAPFTLDGRVYERRMRVRIRFELE